MEQQKKFKFKPRNRQELSSLVRTEGIYLGDIDTSLISDFSYIFYKSARKDFSGLEEWDMSSAITVKSMFDNAKEFNYPIEMNTPNLKDCSNMLYGCDNFNNYIHFSDVSKIENANYMLARCPKFNQDLDFSNSVNLKTAQGMFSMSGLTEKREILLDTTSLTNADKMFMGTKIKQENLNFVFKSNCSLVDAFKEFIPKYYGKKQQKVEKVQHNNFSQNQNNTTNSYFNDNSVELDSDLFSEDTNYSEDELFTDEQLDTESNNFLKNKRDAINYNLSEKHKLEM
ncbi:BspA family leucine-rich repeat surface protein [Mycoplasma anserisalpingitidis]|uniref:BspA family leucine-rich repeat surface protein n=1 Tax=Mycoplasma anserisalpingitidis TaxID=519450 RepID=UPI0011B1842E|nr:BspA family leucine-rich repeat surface protein [Mycoplasma anserisalpingitidis]QDY87729.1 BspA family leucine-rich repeat surface protein [Mycoplasma anserisalpingitidis]